MRAQVTDFAQNDPTYCVTPVIQAVPLPDNSIPLQMGTATQQHKVEQLLEHYPQVLKSWAFDWNGRTPSIMSFFWMDHQGSVAISFSPEDVFSPENALVREGIAKEISTKVLPSVQAEMHKNQTALFNEDVLTWLNTDTRKEDVASLSITRQEFRYIYVLLPTPSASSEKLNPPKDFEQARERYQRQQDREARFHIKEQFWKDLGFYKGQDLCVESGRSAECVTSLWYPSVPEYTYGS